MNFQSEAKLLISADDKSGPGLDSARARLNTLKSTANELGGVLGALGIGLSLAGTVAALKDVVDELDRVNKSAQKIGTTAETLSGLEYAAGQSGVEVQELESSLVKLNRSAVEAQQGTKEQAEAFSALGIEVTDANGRMKTTDQLLLELADAFSQFEDGPAKSALAMQIFGRAGANLIPFLNLGREGVSALMVEARELGVVMDSEAAAAAERFNDNLDKVQKSMRGLAVAAAEDVLPAIADITDAMAEAAKDKGPIYAFWVGMGGAMDQFINGTELGKLHERGDELQAEINRLRKMVTEGGTPIPFSPFTLKFNEQTLAGYTATLKKTEAELAEVNKRIQDILDPPRPKAKPKQDPVTSPLVEAKKVELKDLEQVTKAQERVLSQANRDLDRSMSARAAVANEFKRLFADITAKPIDPNQQIQALDLDRVLREVDVARAAGNLDEAIDKARTAGELIRQAKAQGDYFTELELSYYARRAGEVADNVMADRQTKAEAAQQAARQNLDTLLERAKGLEAIPVGLKVDTSYGEGVIRSFHTAMQEYLERNPLTIKVMADTQGTSRQVSEDVHEVLRSAAVKFGSR